MALIRPSSTYTLKDTVLGTFYVSSASPRNLNVPQSFDFAKEAGKQARMPMCLQNLAQALVVRVEFYEDDKKAKAEKRESGGLDSSNDYQRTSTVSLRLKNDGSFKIDAPYVVGFADLDDSDESRKLVQSGCDANSEGTDLIIVKDAFICDLVSRMRDTGRVAPALTERLLALPAAQVNGKSEYGQYPYAKAAFGDSKIAELNAGYLKARGYDSGKFWDLTAQELEKLLEDKNDHVHVRAVGLGGDDYVDVVSANGYFDGGGRARSVVHVGAQKSSTGNRVTK